MAVFVVFLHRSYYRHFTSLTIVEMWSGETKKQTFNSEKPPKKAVFLRKVVRVTGFEPAASCSQRTELNFFRSFIIVLAVFALFNLLFSRV